MSADPRFDVRGPDEFEERDLSPRPRVAHRIAEPNWPVIAAGVCPACGNYPPCGSAPVGYACENRRTS